MKQLIQKKNPILEPLPLFAILASTFAMIGTGIITFTSTDQQEAIKLTKKVRYECENCGARSVLNNPLENIPDSTKNNSKKFHPVIVKITNGRYRHVLETNRLLLREVTMNDLDALYAIYSNRENAPSSVWKLHKNKQETEQKITEMINHYRSGYPEHWVVCEKKSGTIVGIGGMFGYVPAHHRISMGWTFDSSAWGNGYAAELGMACVEYAMKYLNINRIDATVRIDNIASRKALEKIGLSFKTHFRQYWRIKGELLNHYQFVILKKEIEEQLKQSRI